MYLLEKKRNVLHIVSITEGPTFVAVKEQDLKEIFSLQTRTRNFIGLINFQNENDKYKLISKGRARKI